MEIMGTIETILTGAGVIVGIVILSCMAIWFIWLASKVLVSLTFDLSENDWKERSRTWRVLWHILGTLELVIILNLCYVVGKWANSL